MDRALSEGPAALRPAAQVPTRGEGDRAGGGGETGEEEDGVGGEKGQRGTGRLRADAAA